jgi:hypothetical protein
MVYTAITRQGSLFLWRVRLPGTDGKGNRWWDAAHEAAARARHTWIRIASDLAAGTYAVWAAEGDLGEPTWPNQSFRDLLAMAFKDRLIDTADHPVLKKLLGRV